MSRLILETNLLTIENNARAIKDSVPKDIKILSVVKADAYGHGSRQVANTLAQSGLSDGFAVATVQEGIALREDIKERMITVLGYSDACEMKEAVRFGLSPSVYSVEMLDALDKASRELGIMARAHLKIDTGMNRIGVKGEEKLNNVLGVWKQRENIIMEGAFSHFTSADSDEKFTNEQFEKFLFARKAIDKFGFKPEYHMAASSAMANEKYRLDMVREGIALYGVGYGKIRDRVKPAQKLSTHPVRIENVAKGESIGYSRAFVADRDMKVMTLPCGYGDGYPRILGGRAQVLVKGKRAPVIGNICMDMMMADITGIDPVDLSSEVVLMGRQANDEITPSELAYLSGTIPYEIMLGFSNRVERSWVRK